MSEELCREWPFTWCFVEAHWSMSTKETRFNGIPQNTIWKVIPNIIPQAKFENDCVLRNGHRIKITQPNSMILVSFSSVEDALFSDVKKLDTFSLQGTENLRFRFFGGHPV